MAAFVQSLGLQLLDRAGKPYDARQLAPSDVIAFYFSAHWCPPCRHFTPMLRKFAETLRTNGDSSLKVIFVSSDQSEHDMWKYVYDAHGDWLVLAYSDRASKERLERQYQVSGIPQLVVIDQVGRHAVRDARSEVMAASASSTQVLTTYLGWRTASGATAAAAAPPAVAHMPEGTRVRVRGLTGAPEHNGTEGTVRSFDASKGRYLVELGEKTLSLRAANLLQLLQVRVKPEGSEEWADAAVEDFDEGSGELLLSRDGGAAVRARLGDAGGPVLQAGALVAVHGLKAESARQWNDHNGQVLEHDEAAGRYLVQVAPAVQLKVKPDNLRLCPLC